MSSPEELQRDIDIAERLLDSFNPKETLLTHDAYKAWHAINSWRSMAQWFLDRKDPNWKPTVGDSKRRMAP